MVEFRQNPVPELLVQGSASQQPCQRGLQAHGRQGGTLAQSSLQDRLASHPHCVFCPSTLLPASCRLCPMPVMDHDKHGGP